MKGRRLHSSAICAIVCAIATWALALQGFVVSAAASGALPPGVLCGGPPAPDAPPGAHHPQCCLAPAAPTGVAPRVAGVLVWRVAQVSLAAAPAPRAQTARGPPAA